MSKNSGQDDDFARAAQGDDIKPTQDDLTSPQNDPETVNDETHEAPDGNTVEPSVTQEPQAKDSVVFSASSGAGSKAIDMSEVVDPITQAIRDEILTKQLLLLQEEIAGGMEEQEKQDFLAQDLTAIRAYLQTDAGSQSVDDVMKKPDFSKKMRDLEVGGYKTVHANFKDRFQDVNWQVVGDNIRTVDVKNANGESLCTLKETTVKNEPPQAVTLANGTSQTINKHRQADFPIKADTGPMHASMAVYDANGHSIAASKAVYFTAHYGDDGKLTEISSPTPVHFAGRGDDAIGYIEVDGQVFTLPVTKGKYLEMKQEIAKNNALEAGISQSVEQGNTHNVLEIKGLAEEMAESHKKRNNEAAEPRSEGGGPPVNVKTGKPRECVSQSQPEMQELAEQMKKSRENRGNDKAEPPSQGGGPPVNVKTGKPRESVSQSHPEMQGLAEKMRESCVGRENEAGEPESRGGKKPINVKADKSKEGASQHDAKEAKRVVDDQAPKPQAATTLPKSKPPVPLRTSSLEKSEEPVTLPKSSSTKKQGDISQDSTLDKSTEFEQAAARGRLSRKGRENEAGDPLKGSPVDTRKAASVPLRTSSLKESDEPATDLIKIVKAASQKGSTLNAITGEEVLPNVLRIAEHTRGNVVDGSSSSIKEKSGAGQAITPPSQKKYTTKGGPSGPSY